MKRVAVIHADDGDHKIEITIRFTSKQSLMRYEVNDVVVQAMERIHRSIIGLKYCDFNISNIDVR